MCDYLSILLRGGGIEVEIVANLARVDIKQLFVLGDLAVIWHGDKGEIAL